VADFNETRHKYLSREWAAGTTEKGFKSEVKGQRSKVTAKRTFVAEAYTMVSVFCTFIFDANF